MDIRAQKIQAKSNPSNAGTKHLGLSARLAAFGYLATIARKFRMPFQGFSGLNLRLSIQSLFSHSCDRFTDKCAGWWAPTSHPTSRCQPGARRAYQRLRSGVLIAVGSETGWCGMGSNFVSRLVGSFRVAPLPAVIPAHGRGRQAPTAALGRHER